MAGSRGVNSSCPKRIILKLLFPACQLAGGENRTFPSALFLWLDKRAAATSGCCVLRQRKRCFFSES